jgi:MFS superfamily sulfate permease-like transporter
LIFTVIFDLVVAIGVGVTLNFIIVLLKSLIKIYRKQEVNFKFHYMLDGNVLRFKGSLTFLNDKNSCELLDNENLSGIDTLDLNELEEVDISGAEIVHKTLKRINSGRIVAKNQTKAYLLRRGIKVLDM